MTSVNQSPRRNNQHNDLAASSISSHQQNRDPTLFIHSDKHSGQEIIALQRPTTNNIGVSSRHSKKTTKLQFTRTLDFGRKNSEGQIMNLKQSQKLEEMKQQTRLKSALLPIQEQEKIDREKSTLDRIKSPYSIKHHHQESSGFKDQDIQILKENLLKEIEQSRYLNEILQKRVHSVKDILNIFYSRIEFEDNICLKEGDIRELKMLITTLTSQISTTSQTELQLRLKEREELALKTELNQLKHKFEICQREKEHTERQEKILQEIKKENEDKLMEIRKDMHLEKRKNEFLSRRIMELEKSLAGFTDEFGNPTQKQVSQKSSERELFNSILSNQPPSPDKMLSVAREVSNMRRSSSVFPIQFVEVNKVQDSNRMRHALSALHKQNQGLKKELTLYKKQFAEKVEDIENLNNNIKRLQDKVNFGIKNMFESKLKQSLFQRQNSAGKNAQLQPEISSQESTSRNDNISPVPSIVIRAAPKQHVTTVQLQRPTTPRKKKPQAFELSSTWQLGNRLSGLKKDNLRLIDLLSEVGIDSFISQIKKEVTYSPETVIQVFGTSYISYKEFSDSLHFIINFFIYALNDQLQQFSDNSLSQSSTERLIINFRQRLPNFLNCSRVSVWVKDPTENSLWSILSNKPIKRVATQEILGYGYLNKKPYSLMCQKDIQTHPFYDPEIEDKIYNDEKRRNCIIYPLTQGSSDQVIGIVEFINFKSTKNLTSREEDPRFHFQITQDQHYFIGLFARFANLVLQKDLLDSTSRKNVALREKVCKHGIISLKSQNLKDLTLNVQIAVKEIFNVDQVRLILYNRETKKLRSFMQNEVREEDQNVGICGDLICKNQKRIVLVLNSYEDARFNMKMDLNISTSMFCVPLLTKPKKGLFNDTTQLIGILEFQNNQMKIHNNQATLVNMNSPPQSARLKSQKKLMSQPSKMRNENEIYLTDETLQNQLMGFCDFIVSSIELNNESFFNYLPSETPTPMLSKR